MTTSDTTFILRFRNLPLAGNRPAAPRTSRDLSFHRIWLGMREFCARPAVANGTIVLVFILLIACISLLVADFAQGSAATADRDAFARWEDPQAAEYRKWRTVVDYYLIRERELDRVSGSGRY